MMHHEAIFQGAAAINRPVLTIDVLHDQLIESLTWINQDAVRLLEPLDHFEDTFHHGRARLELELRQRFGD